MRRRLRPPSGKFIVRLDPPLHAALQRDAKAKGVSLNALCVQRLAQVSGTRDEWAPAIARATVVAEGALVGLVVFGSCARREMTDASDVDLLVVVDSTLQITRELYRRWDEDRVGWQGHEVEPHFVHLPAARSELGGVWADIALDGVVIHERSSVVSTRLAELRRELARGSLVRREQNGVYYWVEVAHDA